MDMWSTRTTGLVSKDIMELEEGEEEEEYVYPDTDDAAKQDRGKGPDDKNETDLVSL